MILGKPMGRLSLKQAHAPSFFLEKFESNNAVEKYLALTMKRATRKPLKSGDSIKNGYHTKKKIQQINKRRKARNAFTEYIAEQGLQQTICIHSTEGPLDCHDAAILKITADCLPAFCEQPRFLHS